ncbi:alpha/beta fold hydrolase [Cellulomonas sp. JZ18]|nr:alpha/beta fold hydrolase [Cellulomonas sp. JZ18]
MHRPIVLVHGTRTSSAIWHAQVAVLRHRGHPTHAIDLPGHGARSAERFTLEGALAAIDDAVSACPVPPLLVGLSLGATRRSRTPAGTRASSRGRPRGLLHGDQGQAAAPVPARVAPRDALARPRSGHVARRDGHARGPRRVLPAARPASAAGAGVGRQRPS